MGQDRSKASDEPAQALTGVRIIDLSRVLAGPYATQILGDHGADVIKVEPPAGDETRGWGPPFKDDTAAYYLGINRNKKGIQLDLSDAAQREMLLCLLADADVVIENFKSGTMERWGLGYQTLARRFPRLIYCKISGFGDDGPLGGMPGYDAAIQAMSGLMSVNGATDGPPLRVGVPVVDLVTGLNAAIAMLLALQERERSGKGQLVETTLFDCALSIIHPHMANFLQSGILPRRQGNAHPSITPYDAFQTRTSEIFLAVGNDRQFAKFCAHVGRPELVADPRYSTNRDRNANRTSLREALADALGRLDGNELAAQLIGIGVPCAPIFDLADIVDHPHTRHRDMVVTIDGERVVGSPIKLGRTPAKYRRRAPKIGEHSAEILQSDGPKNSPGIGFRGASRR